jgi:MFS transporter, AAHS family, 4-hydroxybenzoate transporter
MIAHRLGMGRAGSIAGPVIAAQLIARHRASERLFLIAAIPAALSALLVGGMGRLSPRRADSYSARSVR